MSNKNKRFKSGATSIYVVVISALLFSVITVSFIRIILNEASRSTSDELAQAAYDSALAGVEDARTALKRYYECKNSSDSGVCGDKVTGVVATLEGAMADPSDCDGVAKALGRISTVSNKGQEVLIQQSSQAGKDTVQAYTCVNLAEETADYRSTVSAGSTMRVIPLKPTGGAETTRKITGVKIRWFSSEDMETSGDFNYNNKNNFTSLDDSSAPVPPTISARIIQTADNYSYDSFTNSEGDTTNRGAVYLVPTDESGGINHITRDKIVESNNHNPDNASENLPIKVKCDRSNEDYACSASIEIPAPIGASIGAGGAVSSRNRDTFFLILTLPYGQPSTEFSVQMCTDGGGGGSPRGSCTEIANFDGVQVAVDSTGRANNMYSRVEARLELNDIYFPFPEFGLLATGSDNDAISKNFYVTKNCWKVDETVDGEGNRTVGYCKRDDDGNVTEGNDTGLLNDPGAKDTENDDI